MDYKILKHQEKAFYKGEQSAYFRVSGYLPDFYFRLQYVQMPLRF